METLPQMHELLWFNDGNVVLATDTLLFRVHKGILALHSTVMRDMFTLVQDPITIDRDSERISSAVDVESCSDLYDGLPLVRLSGDKGQDVAHLLRAIFERGYYNRDDDETPLDVVIALLSLSAKYDIASVRTDVVKQLSRSFPSSLHSYESLSIPGATLFGRAREETYFPILRACLPKQEDIEPLLATLFYACGTMGINKIVKELPTLPIPTMGALLMGKRYLESNIIMTMYSRLEATSPRFGCPFASSDGVCSTARFAPLSEKAKELHSSPTLSNMKGDEVMSAFFQRRCKNCQTKITESFEGSRLLIWDRIPAYFGLKKY